MVLAQSPGAALNKSFADNKQRRWKSGLISSRGEALIRGAASNTGFMVSKVFQEL